LLVGDDRAVLHRQDPVGRGGNVRFVRDEDNRHALLTIERDKPIHEFVQGAGIQIAGRLVSEQKAWCVDERAGDGNAPLLAARKLARRVALPIAEADELQRLTRPLGSHGAAQRLRGRVIER